jgi:hypothetical protein
LRPPRKRLLFTGLILAAAAAWYVSTRRADHGAAGSSAYPAPRCAGDLSRRTDVFPVGSAREIERDRDWLRDAAGRYVLLRGVNLASRSKLPPYLPVLPLETTTLSGPAVARELERLRPELCRLQDLGVSVVRLLVLWKGIEPDHQEGRTELSPRGRAYLEALRQVVDALHEQGILVILDFHQDVASELYGGDGFPDWAVAIDEAHPRPDPVPAASEMWGARYFDILPGSLSQGVRHTLRSFWRNRLTNTEAGLVDDPVQTHLVRTIGLTAEFFAGHPAVLGYEPFNEPAQAGLPKAEFERGPLRAFYEAVLEEVRLRDPRAFVFLEPRLDWTTYPADQPEPSLRRPWTILGFTTRPVTFLDIEGLTRDRRAVVSFHYYDPWLVAGTPWRRSVAERARSWADMFAAMDGAIRSRGAIPFLTEFGCMQHWTGRSDFEPETYGTITRACLELQYRQVEARLLSATYWNYDFYSRRDKRGKASENWNEENLSLLGPEGPRHFDIAARPYPMRSTARPERLAFDLASRQAEIVLAGGVVPGEPTVIFVPQRIHYGQGFDVRSTSSRAPVWDEQRQRLYWWPSPADARHVLVISPAGRFDAARLSAAGRDARTRVTSFAPAAP